MMENNILNISEECEDCFESCIESKAIPSCICYEGEPWHYERMLDKDSCPYLYDRLSEIFNDNFDDVKRLWNKEKKSKKK